MSMCCASLRYSFARQARYLGEFAMWEIEAVLLTSAQDVARMQHRAARHLD